MFRKRRACTVLRPTWVESDRLHARLVEQHLELRHLHHHHDTPTNHNTSTAASAGTTRASPAPA